MTVNNTFGVRSDLHARWELAMDHNRENLAGIFDLGDIEAEYIKKHHELRNLQTPKEKTYEAIIRNSYENFFLFCNVVNSMSTNSELILNILGEYKGIYRGIKGNSEESWENIIKEATTGNDDELKKLHEMFESFNLIKEAKSEFYFNGNLYSSKEISGEKPSTGIIYLPWKASMESVNLALDDLSRFDLARIIIMSHDYLTKNSLIDEPEKRMENEEQIITTLDNLAKTSAMVEGFYGHIGLEYGSFFKEFNHDGKTIKTYHADEKDGKLLELQL